MNKKLSSCLLMAAFLLAAAGGLSAQLPPQEKPAPPAGAQAPAVQPPMPAPSTTQHTIKVGGKALNYTATAAMMPMTDDNGKLMANIFYIAYTLNGVPDKTKRPVLFSFNGGPGSSSVWMHMGFLGPRKVVYDDEGFALKPPYKLEDNASSILDEADLVFIDPVATGYSRMAAGEDLHKFHGVMEDLESVGDFIRRWVSKNGRWDSPKFIIGESYGTTRASGLTGYLQSRYNMYLNGTILVSSMTLGVRLGADAETAMIFPHFTATAWYHKRLPADLQAKPLRDVLDESEKFAGGEYLVALGKGNGLAAAEKDAVAAKLSRYSGLGADFYSRSNLRVDAMQFRKELLRDKGITVGRLDSRYAEPDKSAAGEYPEGDAAMSNWSGAFTGAVNQYFKNELKFETDLNYNIFGDVGMWRGMNMYGEMESPRGAGFFGRLEGVGEMLRQAMVQNPHHKVLVLAGYYDGGCDYYSAEYAFSHLDPAGSIRDRVKFAYYECGHMMYIRKADLAKAKTDVAAFIRSCLAD